MDKMYWTINTMTIMKNTFLNIFNPYWKSFIDF